MLHMIRKSERNYQRCIKAVQRKGYDKEEATSIVRKIFADYSPNPNGLRLDQRVNMVLAKDEWQREQAQYFSFVSANRTCNKNVPCAEG